MSGRVVDFRVASLPTTHGENLVLRILDRQKGIVPLDKLNLEEPALELLKLMITRPEGIILVTGPTGSGKTTTLYSILNHINSDAVNVMTLEDPVEYPMTLIRQTSVAEAGQARFRQRHPRHDAPGPRRDPGRRDPRPRDRRDGVPRRDDRPSGVLHAPHQFGGGRVSAPARHRHPAPTSSRATSSASWRSAWCGACAGPAASPTTRT
jgi:energy-coupling factor transporter ATP-binding protein EcfA2